MNITARLGISILILLAVTGCQQAEDPSQDKEVTPAQSAAGQSNRSEDPALQRQQQHAATVTIMRDDYGVPHIYGKTDADAVFGLMYAQAEDDFPRIERNYYWAIGRLAEVEGELALYSDLRARLYMTEAEARSFYANAPDWLQALCQAWADGLNYYLHTHPEVQPKLISQFQPWMTMYFFEGSIGGDIEQIPLPRIADFYADVPDPAAVASASRSDSSATALELVSLTRQDNEPRGSNGFAISGELTRSGHAMLLINPHTSFYFRGEVHVVSEQGLNAYGAVTWGQFFIYQGFNEHTGWMHTSTYADFIDEFVEQVERRDGALMYRYGDDWRPVEVAEVTLNYRDDDGKLQARTFPMYRTHHGPITHTVNGQWTATRINWNPVDALRQSWLRMRQQDYDSFRDMMQIRTNSSNNTVFADSSGNIAYFHGNFIPRRDSRFDYAQPVDGSDPATDWQGAHAIDEVVTILNPANGWIQNANSTPYTAAGEFSPDPDDYAAYMAPDAQNFRAIHAVRMLLQADDLTLDKLIELAYDPQLPAFELLVPAVIQAADELGGKPMVAEAVAVLRDWDQRVALDSVAMTLMHFYADRFLQQADFPPGLSRMQQVEYLATQTTAAQRLAVLEQTLKQLQADFGHWNVPWGKVNRFQRITGDIDSIFDDDLPSLPVPMASGKWGALASFGVIHGEDANAEVNKKLYGVAGNSFVAVVEFADKVQAKTLLAGGQSGDPASAHFLDQAQNYVAVQFKDVAFYRDDVERRVRRSYQPGFDRKAVP